MKVLACRARAFSPLLAKVLCLLGQAECWAKLNGSSARGKCGASWQKLGPHVKCQVPSSTFVARNAGLG